MGPPDEIVTRRALSIEVTGCCCLPIAILQARNTYGLRATSRYRLVNGYGRVIDGTDI